LYQNSIDGMGYSFFLINYDPTFLSNPRTFPGYTIRTFNFDLLSEAEQAQFDSMWASGWFATLEDVKNQSQFAHAWETVTRTTANHGPFAFGYVLYEGGAGHEHGPNVINMRWMGAAHFGSDIFVYFRFDVAPGQAAGATADIDFWTVETGNAMMVNAASNAPVPVNAVNGGVAIVD